METPSPDRPLVALIADDEGPILDLLADILTQLGYKIGGRARNGAELVDLVRSTPADFVVLDIFMPVLDGLEAARIILAEKPMPVIVSTGVATEQTVEEARRLPVQAFLSKPFRREQLRASIAIALTQWELQQEQARKLRSFLELGLGGSPRISEEVAVRFDLTPREFEVLCRIAEGKSNAEIGQVIGAATRTVDKHVEHLFSKLAVKTRTAAVARALHLAA